MTSNRRAMRGGNNSRFVIATTNVLQLTLSYKFPFFGVRVDFPIVMRVYSCSACVSPLSCSFTPQFRAEFGIVSDSHRVGARMAAVELTARTRQSSQSGQRCCPCLRHASVHALLLPRCAFHPFHWIRLRNSDNTFSGFAI